MRSAKATAKPSAIWKTKAVGFAVATALIGAVTTTSGGASAAVEVSGTGKGIAGGALLGGEVGALGLAAFGARQPWLYYTVPAAFAIGGGIGGYYIEKSAEPEVPLFMLAGGMALLIPTVVISLSATTYRAGPPGSEDQVPSDATPAEPTAGGSVKVDGSSPGVTGSPAPAGGGTTTTTPPSPPNHKPSKTSLRLPETPRSFALVNWDASALRLGVPAVAMKPTYTVTEMAKFGVAQRWEVHAPIVDVAF